MRWSAVLAILVLSGLAGTPSSSQAQDDGWVSKTPMPTPRDEHVSCAIGRYVYILGGAPEEGQAILATVDRYDTVTDTWTTLGSMPTPRTNMTASVVDGKCYAIGGLAASGAMSVVEIYDPASDEWTVGADMPTARYGAASAVINNFIYVVGGLSGNDYLTSQEAYDPGTDSWTTLEPIPTGRVAATASALDGKLYVMGGNIAFLVSTDTVEVYNVASNQWSTAASMPSDLFYLSSSAVNGKLYVTGGAGRQSSTSDVIIFDPSANGWMSTHSLLEVRNRHTSEFVQGVLYVFGGAERIAGAPHLTKATVEALELLDETFAIDAGINGNWWNGPARDGEGVQIEVADDLNGGLVFVATIYSYDPMGNQIFLIAVGSVVGETVTVDVFISDGGAWGPDFDPDLIEQPQWGTGMFTAVSCELVEMSLIPNAQYRALGYTNLAYSLERLTISLIPCPTE